MAMQEDDGFRTAFGPVKTLQGGSIGGKAGFKVGDRIVKVDGRTIGTGKPGAITNKLITAFHTVTRKDGVKY